MSLTTIDTRTRTTRTLYLREILAWDKLVKGNANSRSYSRGSADKQDDCLTLQDFEGDQVQYSDDDRIKIAEFWGRE